MLLRGKKERVNLNECIGNCRGSFTVFNVTGRTTHELTKSYPKQHALAAHAHNSACILL